MPAVPPVAPLAYPQQPPARKSVAYPHPLRMPTGGTPRAHAHRIRPTPRARTPFAPTLVAQANPSRKHTPRAPKPVAPTSVITKLVPYTNPSHAHPLPRTRELVPLASPRRKHPPHAYVALLARYLGAYASLLTQLQGVDVWDLPVLLLRPRVCRMRRCKCCKSRGRRGGIREPSRRCDGRGRI
ncbi:hypothetical protein K438DRAFT_566297 [Mycena galopus ATCC 62051]|nr:hypothetical protein K438DRAFT_566297 [Mycena galopus ATCC 62051]